MKTTIDIPNTDLKQAIRFSGAKTKREAVITALREYNRMQKAKRAVQLLGTFSELLSNDEIEKLELDENSH